MSDVHTLEAQQQRVEALITALETLDDTKASAAAKALLQVVLDLHAGGLARMMEIVSAAGAAGDPVIEAMVVDPSVCALLNLHGLHPYDIPTRVARAVDKMRPMLGAQGIQVQLLDAADEAVRVRVRGRLQGDHATPEGLRHEIELAIFEQAPEVMRVEVEGLPDVNVHELRFMPRQAAVRDQAEAGPP